jgi:glycosyltransferase involved in cell wall biosynthesis
LGIDEAFLRTVKHYQQDSSKIELLTVAELISRKNIAMIIKAFSILSEKYKNLKYTIIGRGQEKENLVNLISSLNLTEKVKMIDNINHKLLPEMMSHFDIFILASWYETFGRVYFEAMASGLPVICSKNTGIDGYFVEGSEAMSVQYDNLDDIVKTLSYLIDNPLLQKKLGENGRELVKDFTWEKISKKYLQYYTSSGKAFAGEPDTNEKTI